MTITEALAEIKLIDNKVDSQKKTALQYLVHPDNLKDPLENKGGSKTVVKGCKQSIESLIANKVRLRLAINRANAETLVKIGVQEKSVSEWLVWRREAVPAYKECLNRLHSEIIRERQRYAKTSQKDGEKAVGMVVNLDELGLVKELEEIEAALGELDPKLSMHNALTQIAVV